MKGWSETQGDTHLQLRYFTYGTDEGIVAGANLSVMFTIDRPAKDVWPHLKTSIAGRTHMVTTTPEWSAIFIPAQSWTSEARPFT